MPILKDFIELENSGAVPKGAAPLVFWDGYGLDNLQSGVGIHGRQLANELLQLDVRPVLIGNYEACHNFEELNSFLLPNSLGKFSSNKIVWPQRVETKVAAFCDRSEKRPVVLHGLSNINLSTLPFTSSRNIKRVITVHDVIPLIAPKSVSKAMFLQFSLALPQILKRADRIICVSEWTKSEVLKRFSWAEEKITVIANGYSAPHSKVSVKTGAERKNHFNILSVGRFEPYKRHEFLLEIIKNTTDLRLDLVTDEAGKTHVLKSIPQLVESGRVRVHVNQPNQALHDLYRSSDCYVQTSLFEGYCLPAAESLAQGTPVVYQSGSGIDEVCGSSVCTPMSQDDDKEKWASQIRRQIQLSRQPAFLEDLSEHINELTSWKEAAIKLNSVYNSFSES